MSEIKELALTESRSLREQYADRTDVLDKVKALQMMPDDQHVNTRMVAAYYEVPISTIDGLAAAHREELEANGRRILTGADLQAFATPFGGVAKLLGPKTRSFAIFSRRAVLNVGQLLRDSPVARQVRTYLLNAEATPAASDMSKSDWIRQALEIEQQREHLAIENAKLRVKADQYDEWLNGKGCYLIDNVAKMIGIGPGVMWKFLYAEKILIKSDTKRHRAPYSRKDTVGWFEVKPVSPDRANGHASHTTYFTPYGAERVRLLLIKRGLLPHEQLALISGGL